MAAEGFSGRIDIVVGDAKLFASLLDDGCDLGVVGLDHSGEEVVSCLVVEGASHQRPKPAASGVVLRRSHLHLSPGKFKNYRD